ncbi:hypothetical protein EJB05_57718 [Eragrostis curvula]|uniref:Knottin scorpion toxin-like domain-containing protein n=1 Tax=Eragrostis curvula TaxID=38414 RepID=A0A5J9SD59_9POAL|nr:hypothetical protein EJB05_57718 [Eragrostis curvula]
MKLAPLLTALVFITASVEMMEVAGQGAAPVCDIFSETCSGKCWKASDCVDCCKHHGFVHGKCRITHGDACYCCHTPDATAKAWLDELTH